jgi:hypothetical protein
MTIKLNQQKSLPINRGLQPIYMTSSLIAIMMAVVSVVGLTNRTLIYSSEELVQGFLPNDIANLLIGLPILIGCMWAARRGKLAGLLCWPGALIFVIYNYFAYVYAIPLSWAYLGYLSLVALSIYTLIGLVASIDREAVATRLAGKVPEKFAGGVLAGFGGLFLLRVFLEIGGTLTGGDPMPVPELAANISDFFTSPMLIIGGVLLWRRRAFGYLAGLGLLFQASMLFVALVLFLVVQPMLTDAPFAAMDVIFVLVMGLVCFVPFGLYLRGVIRQD